MKTQDVFNTGDLICGQFSDPPPPPPPRPRFKKKKKEKKRKRDRERERELPDKVSSIELSLYWPCFLLSEGSLKACYKEFKKVQLCMDSHTQYF